MKNPLKLSLAIIFFLIFLKTAFAAEPQFLISWSAQNYVPSWYSGKILPSKGTPVFVSFELIDNGKIVNLSKEKIRWYLNDKMMLNEDSGLGVKSFYFINNNYYNQDIEIRISLPDYKNQPLNKIISIPVVSSDVAIDASYPNRQINTGKNEINAYPFFFNVSDIGGLSFDWEIDNGSAQEGENTSSQKLELNVDQKAPSGFSMDIKVTVKNLLDQLQFAVKNIRLTIR